MKSQADLILNALRKGDTITPLDALQRFSCFRLGARIFDLKAKGYEIENIGADDGNYACYKLKHPNPVPKMPEAFPKKEKVENQPQLFA